VPRFRPTAAFRFDADRPVPSGAELRELLDEMLAPANFFIAPGLRVQCTQGEEETAWEIFQGRLLDPTQTRRKYRFESWNLHVVTAEGCAAEPLLSLKLDRDAGEVHVVRGIESYVWEGYDAGGNVFLSREVRKWVRELAGTVALSRFAALGDLRDELACQFFHAVVGSSRLPLASVETPLPQFSLGELFYCYRPYAGACDWYLTTYRELAAAMLTEQAALPERGRLLEVFLHAAPFAEMENAVALFVKRWRDLGATAGELAALLRRMFNDVSLSPYTDLVDKTLAFVHALETRGDFSSEAVLDFLGHLLRQNGRHLTAYDLVTFHHRGANYPDALLLDAVLKEYLRRAEYQAGLFIDRDGDNDAVLTAKRRRRRALRQGFLLRRRYENHPVPDLPTSPGENARVLPPEYPRVPEEQLTQPPRRTKKLFAGDPLTDHLTPRGAAVLRQSVADLDHPEELRELGMALFLDRPFGAGKAPAEPDATLLLSCEAFSRSVADERLRFLAESLGMLTPEECESHRRRLHEMPVNGLPLDAIGSPPRPGVIALSDARRAAPDFIFLRTTSTTLRNLFDQYDFMALRSRARLDFLSQPRDLLLARALDGASLILHDAALRPRLELVVDTRFGYLCRAGQEFPVAGLSVRRLWEDAPSGQIVERDVRADPIAIRARLGP
jgi:hypothetical protein